VAEARRLLQSARPVTVSVLQRPEVSDHDFMEEQEHFLKRLCERTMALPVGRGLAALRTATALPTETLDIPRLCLTGKAPPRGAKVELTHIDVSQNMEHWPSFHNGVAAGLRLSAEPGSHDIDSTWICFNKPKGGETTAQTEHAGFLMALGLNGHLAKLGKLESFDYLMKGSEPISIGLLLGMSASRLGSMDVLVTKKLSTQLEALLPPTATELPLSHNTQVAALMGLGLLYADTGHRRMVEVCLRELSRPPGPELENCVDRESYSLTAGLALGTITMGRGEALVAGRLADLSLPEVLHAHMAGGPRPAPGPGARERPPTYQIKEGDSINIDVTSPGATLALGMLYWRSGNKAIAAWMEAPETSFLLEFVRPDFLLLRTLAHGLILWDSVSPSMDWVEGHVPAAIRPFCLVRPPDSPAPGQEHLDYETINQAYCNIVAGACFALALRFAGTWNNAAFETIDQLIGKFIAVTKRSIADLTGKAVVEQTICILVLAQAIVMAGSGDLATLRTCRMLRSRVHNSTVVNYGSHMAVHLAIGLLFLGGGRLGLASTPGALAAMIAAFFPKFPTHSSDNRYHLQALRHLYVLAVEPRAVLPRCSASGRLVPVQLRLHYRPTAAHPGLGLTVRAPTLLPSLHLLSSVAVSDPQYWATVFTPGESGAWPALAALLQRGGHMPVKRREGAGLEPSLHWALGRAQLQGLRTGHWAAYSDLFLRDCPPAWVSSLHCLLSCCLATSCPALLPVWTALLARARPDTAQAGQLAQQTAVLESVCRRQGAGSALLQPELAVSLGQRTALAMDRAASWPGQGGLGAALAGHLQGRPTPLAPDRQQLVATALALHGLRPAAGEAAAELAVGNPLRMRRVLGASSRPATLYRLLA
jgi:anaphase-promoting complex subunit 1